MDAPRLADALGLPSLLIKRDDLTGFAVAGNKARTLGPLLAEAARRGADVLVTGGTPGSNFVQAASAAAAFAGIRCVLVLAGPPVAADSHPNLAAAIVWGAEVRFTGDPDRTSVDRALPDVASALTAQGARPYLCPRGGSNAVGAEGFRDAVDELLAQLDALPPGHASEPVVVVVAAGAGGTLAGLVAGLVAHDRPLRVVGASVSRPVEQLHGQVLSLATEVAQRRREPHPVAADVELVDARGPGHGIASPEGDLVADIALRTAGLVLDPVYTAKALAVLPAIAAGRPALFWHTGGLLDAVAGLLTATTRGAA